MTRKCKHSGNLLLIHQRQWLELPPLSKDIPKDYSSHSGFGKCLCQLWWHRPDARVPREDEQGRLQMGVCAGPHVWFEASLGCAVRPTSKSEAGEAAHLWHNWLWAPCPPGFSFPSAVMTGIHHTGVNTAATTHFSSGFCCWDRLRPVWSLTCYVSRADLNPYHPAFRVLVLTGASPWIWWLALRKKLIQRHHSLFSWKLKIPSYNNEEKDIWVSWCTPIIPVLGRQRQADL